MSDPGLPPHEQFKARGLCGWYVLMVLEADGTPSDGVAHSRTCFVVTDPAMNATKVGPVAVEEVPPGTLACGHCGGGAWKRWSAQH